jgi:hypothetical protein
LTEVQLAVKSEEKAYYLSQSHLLNKKSSRRNYRELELPVLWWIRGQIFLAGNPDPFPAAGRGVGGREII